MKKATLVERHLKLTIVIVIVIGKQNAEEMEEKYKNVFWKGVRAIISKGFFKAIKFKENLNSWLKNLEKRYNTIVKVLNKIALSRAILSYTLAVFNPLYYNFSTFWCTQIKLVRKKLWCYLDIEAANN